LLHLFDFILHAQPHACKVDGNDPIPLCLGVLCSPSGSASNASIIEGTVEASIGGDRIFDHRFYCCLLSHVGLNECRVSSRTFDALDRLFTTVNEDISDHDLCAFAGKGERGGLTDS